MIENLSSFFADMHLVLLGSSTPTSINTEAQAGIYWTKVSIDTFGSGDNKFADHRPINVRRVRYTSVADLWQARQISAFGVLLLNNPCTQHPEILVGSGMFQSTSPVRFRQRIAQLHEQRQEGRHRSAASAEIRLERRYPRYRRVQLFQRTSASLSWPARPGVPICPTSLRLRSYRARQRRSRHLEDTFIA